MFKSNDSRVYGGKPEYVHIADGMRKEMGEALARWLDTEMRFNAGRHAGNKPLCPGCYMIALFNAAVALADANGQSRTELGRTLSSAFSKLAEHPESGMTEEIAVMLDPEEPKAQGQGPEEDREISMAQAVTYALGGPMLF